MRYGILAIIRTVALLLLSWMLSGCGEQKVAGQVFVVTQGKENIKLALVIVGAIPLEEFEQYLQAKQSEKRDKQQPLLPKYNEAKKQLPLYEESLNASIRFANVLMENELTDSAKKSLNKANKEKAEIDELKSVIAKYEAFDKAEFLFDGLPQAKFISKTDADGKFSLTLPKGKYVIAANSSRNVVGSVETYHWLVMVDGSSPNQKLMLSNDNLLETKCGECVKLQ